MTKFKDPVSAYLQKRGFHFRPFYSNFSGFRYVIVVVPCYDELENLPALWQSLLSADMPEGGSVALLFVVNHPEDASPERKVRSPETAEWLKARGEEHKLDIAVVDLFSPGVEVPAKHAGAGYPRKAGLDAALGLTDPESSENSLLVSLDADCEVSPEYFRVLTKLAREGCQAAVLEYRHRIDDPANAPAIQEYEAYLRSYTEGLRYAGSPYAYHFIGSTMACSVSTYVKAGGMNMRRAAEDFYFLEAIAKVTPIQTIEPALVFPSNRVSDRVIFGTGKAMTRRVESGESIAPYPHEAFEVLRQFLEVYSFPYPSVPELIAAIQTLNPRVFDFLESYKFTRAMEQIHATSKTPKQLLRQKHLWFDALKTMRFVGSVASGE